MSYRVNKKAMKCEVKMTECHICKKNGESIQICSTHNFRDMKGRVVCERFLKKLRDNQCYKCHGVGHFADNCTGKFKPVKDICLEVKKVIKMLERKPELEVKSKPKAVTQNAFAAFDEDDEEEDDKPPANVTMRKHVPHKYKNWADYDSDDE